MIGYLVAVVLMTGVCLLAAAPPLPSTSRPLHWTYVLGGFLVNELPFVALFWLALWTLQAAIGGHLAEPLGLVGLSITGAAVGLLTVVARRGFGARAELASALHDAFGPEGAPSLSPHHPWGRILLAPLSFRGRQVRRHANVAYGDAGRRQLLDVYHHRSRRGGPVLVYFHGGGFRSGHKNREAKPLLHRLARRGWVCVSANYRLAPAARFPDHLLDAQRAIAWARRHAGDYGGDAARVYAAGSSAGGHLATMCALAPDGVAEAAAGRPLLGAISLYGFYGSPDGGEGAASSPHDVVHAGAPPVFVAHGDLDTLVLVDDARAFARHLAEVSQNPVVYAELHGAQHGFDLFRSARFEAVVDAIEVFLARTLPRP